MRAIEGEKGRGTRLEEEPEEGVAALFLAPTPDDVTLTPWQKKKDEFIAYINSLFLVENTSFVAMKP